MKTKKLTIIKGRGTKNEARTRPCQSPLGIETDITLYWSARLGRWVTIPE